MTLLHSSDPALPPGALYGVETARGRENFQLSRHRLGDYPALVCALLLIKRAAAQANAELGELSWDLAHAIIAAADDLRQELLPEQFPVDMIHGGGGTSVNMKLNEVLATLASRRLGSPVLPHDHVNRGQSTPLSPADTRR